MRQATVRLRNEEHSALKDSLSTASEAMEEFKNQQVLMDSGLLGVALVKSCEQGRAMINNMPQIIIELEVKVGDGAPYSVATKMVIPMTSLATIASGNTIGVLVDPNNPESLMIDWNRPQTERNKYQILAAGDLRSPSSIRTRYLVCANRN